MHGENTETTQQKAWTTDGQSLHLALQSCSTQASWPGQAKVLVNSDMLTLCLIGLQCACTLRVLCRPVQQGWRSCAETKHNPELPWHAVPESARAACFTKLAATPTVYFLESLGRPVGPLHQEKSLMESPPTSRHDSCADKQDDVLLLHVS